MVVVIKCEPYRIGLKIRNKKIVHSLTFSDRKGYRSLPTLSDRRGQGSPFTQTDRKGYGPILTLTDRRDRISLDIERQERILISL